MRITFLISSLSSGGAERVATILANKWVEKKHHVDFITFENQGALPFYKVDREINIYKTNSRKDNNNIIRKIIGFLSKVIKINLFIRQSKPDIIVSFMTENNIYAIISKFISKRPVVISERIHPSYHDISKSKAYLRKFIYPYSNKLIVQTKDISSWYQKELNIPNKIIPNPVHKPCNYKKYESDNDRKIILSIGRLEFQKGWDILIHSFSKVARFNPEWDLHIYGTGRLQAELTGMIEEYKLTDRVFLKGISNDIERTYREAELFVHTARYEGFPNVILEALAAEKCILTLSSLESACEILDAGTYGILCNLDSLEQEMDRLMKNKKLRSHYEIKSVEAVEKYDTDKIADQWIEVFNQVLSGKNNT